MHRTVLVALAFLTCAGNVQAGGMSLLQNCKDYFADRDFDCACTLRFLEPRFSRADLDLVLRVWGYSLDGRHNHSDDFQFVYASYGYKKVDEVLRQFRRVRLKLFLQCPESSPSSEDDE